MLSIEEVKIFLSQVLQIADADSLLTNHDKYGALVEFITAYREREPFQNISLLATDIEIRRAPTWEEVRTAMILKQGGLCFDHHWFVFELHVLKTIGYQVSLVHSTVGYTNNHVIIIVRNLKQNGDKYLLEVAAGVPAFQPISLDFENESPVFETNYLEYKFIKRDGKYMRLHGDGDIKPKVMPKNTLYIGKWRRFYDFELKEFHNFDEFKKDMNSVYTSPEWMTENENNELVTIEMENEEEIVAFLKTLTSAFGEDTLSKALVNYKQFQL